MSEDLTFDYKGVDASGAPLSDAVVAASRREAIRKLARDNVTVVEIALREERRSSMALPFSRQGVTSGDRVLILRQLSLLARAGVELLDALETVAGGMGGDAATELRNAAQGLRRGDRMAEAFAASAPGYPGYVYALISVGEASGALSRVLEDAASLMAFDERVRRDVTSALTYPAFLVTAGVAAVGFLFYEVVPRFSSMIGAGRGDVGGLAGFVLAGGEFFRANAIIILAALVATAFAVAAVMSRPEGRRALYDIAVATPGLGGLLGARERATWARIMSFALANGVGIMEAADLAGKSVPDGRLKRGLAAAARAIKTGKPIDEAYGEPGVLHRIDRSLLRAGQKGGQLPSMFGFIADRYEEALRDAIKRVTALVEPIAIGFVALAVGAVALGLVTAMSSVYESVL